MSQEAGLKTLMQLLDEGLALAREGWLGVSRVEGLRRQSEALEKQQVLAESHVEAYEESVAAQQPDGSQLRLDFWRTEFRLLTEARRSARAAAEALAFLREQVEREVALAHHRRGRGSKPEALA